MIIALILSGGTGTRLGSDIPKQYIEAGGRPVITYSIEQLYRHSGIEAIQIVADPVWQGKISNWLTAYGFSGKFKGFSRPGGNRQLSILHGLEDIREYAKESDYVFIHDAARPLLTKKQITDCIESVVGHDGVLPVLPMKDTVYLSTDGKKITELLNRVKYMPDKPRSYSGLVLITKPTAAYCLNKSGRLTAPQSRQSWQDRTL